MKKNILKKDHVRPFLRKLARDSRLIAPVRTSHGDLLYQEIESIDSAEIDLSEQPQESAKQFLFPQQEQLFTYQSTGNGFTFSPRKSGMPTVLFGLRSCDISAILYMDVIFLRSPRDHYYLQKRKDTIIIGIGCNEPWDNCFCSATRTGPFLEIGFDLQLTDLGDRFYVESGRAVGDEILEKWPQFFSPVTEEDEKLRYQLMLEARSSFKRHVHVETAFQKIADNSVSPSVWEHIARRCDGCGGCAYICPTCTCFTIFDRPLSPHTGERLRTWDACTHDGFTRMAGGHNPVNPATDRLKRRFMHKLYYDYKQFNRPGCVGCGRCVGICFGGVDIAMFVDMVCAEGMDQRQNAAVIGDLLVEAGLVTRKQLSKALEKRDRTGTTLGSILMEMGIVTKEDIANCLADKVERL